MSLLICPNCKTGMTAVLRHGVEFDVCSECLGIWLDRGELDKILAVERERQAAPEPASFLPRDRQPSGPAPSPWSAAPPHGGHHEDYRHGKRPWGDHHGHAEHHDKHGKPRGWRSVLDIFD
ncbi:TFIIB-type zinc ribbon-containing protein [Azospirillum sp. sgz301742]